MFGFRDRPHRPLRHLSLDDPAQIWLTIGRFGGTLTEAHSRCNISLQNSAHHRICSPARVFRKYRSLIAPGITAPPLPKIPLVDNGDGRAVRAIWHQADSRPRYEVATLPNLCQQYPTMAKLRRSPNDRRAAFGS
jgi:hypothetical protein